MKTKSSLSSVVAVVESSFNEGLKSRDFVLTRVGPRLIPPMLFEDVGVGVRDFFSRSRERSLLRSRSLSLLFFDFEDDEDEEVEEEGDTASGEFPAN